MLKYTISTLDTKVRRDICEAVRLLSGVGIPIEWCHSPIEEEIIVRISNGNPQFDQMEKENVMLKKELDRLRCVYTGCDAENLRLFKENEKLKQELAELSLF